MHFWPHESTCQNIAERSKRISSMWTNCIEDVTSKSKKFKLWILEEEEQSIIIKDARDIVAQKNA